MPTVSVRCAIQLCADLEKDKELKHADRVKFAVWFHDVIYQVGRQMFCLCFSVHSINARLVDCQGRGPQRGAERRSLCEVCLRSQAGGFSCSARSSIRSRALTSRPPAWLPACVPVRSLLRPARRCAGTFWRPRRTRARRATRTFSSCWTWTSPSSQRRRQVGTVFRGPCPLPPQDPRDLVDVLVCVSMRGRAVCDRPALG